MKRFTEIERSFSELSGSEIVILPVPYDETSTWIKGADKGPFAILEASQALELYDIETDSEVYKHGIHTLSALKADSSPEIMVDQVKDKVRELLDLDKFVVTLGGEHSVTVGAVKAYREKFDNICVLQLDAHADLRDEYLGSKYNHACVGARVKEICSLVHVGVRSMCFEEKLVADENNIFFAKDIISDKNRINELIENLPDNLYVTIDLDVFDPAIMPSTGTPEPGGFDWYQVTGFLKAVVQKKRVLGFDVMELCPNEVNKAPDFLAAKLIYKFLSYIYGCSRV